MNQEESGMSSGYEASPADVQSVILDWVKATEAFHHRYSRLTEAINMLQSSARQNPVVSRTRLRRLTELRQHMSDVLMTLLLDMTGSKPNRSARPSKPGQLQSHACLLDELNQEIDAELMRVSTVAQA